MCEVPRSATVIMRLMRPLFVTLKENKAENFTPSEYSSPTPIEIILQNMVCKFS